MSAQSSEGAEPNLTPILDMVFQLITFFMLVINFKGASLDQSLMLPVLGSAQPMDRQGEWEPLVLNVDQDGRVTAFGGPVENIESFVAREAHVVREQLKAKKEAHDKELPVPVILRGDQRVRFHQLNQVVAICQKHGYRHFDLSAMTREDK